MSYDLSNILDKVFSDEPSSAPKTWLGTLLVNPITFQGDNYQQYNELGGLEFVDLATFRLPSATIAQFRRSKNVVKTKANAALGTVKELYGFDDWRIDIMGRCIDDPGHPQAPLRKQQLERLFAFDRLAGAITVLGTDFEDRNISAIVIESMETQQPKGKEHITDFRLRCVSDQPFELSNVS